MRSTVISERRAIMARLSLFLAVVAGVFQYMSVAARADTPIPPRILGTNPTSSEGSPASTTVPLVLGEAEPEGGVIIQGTKSSLFGSNGLAALAVKNPTQHPEYEIVIYGQADCAGAPLGRGLAGSFEEGGIAVTVPADAMTVLSADQVDPASPSVVSGCSSALPYWEGNVPAAGGSPGGGSEGGGGGSTAQPGGQPSAGVGSAVSTGKPEPPHLHLSPGAVANNNFPTVAGSAPGAANVLLYPNGSCSGAPVAKGLAAQLASGFTVQVADNTTTTFSAVSVGGKRSDCSSSVSYVEDSTAPVTRVTMGPGVKTRKHKVVFRFADVTEDPPGTSFFCKVDKAKWKRCASPFRLSHLHSSRYVVRVRAVDLAGNAEKVGAKRTFTVIRGS